jgi:hypothetical protein
VTLLRTVRVKAVIERPLPPPGIVAPFPERAEWWSGVLLSWRWVDKAQRTWTCLVRYQREGLLYEHWISGELLDVGPDNKAAAPTPEG